MKKTVFFTGAGMSATFGYPLTSDLLPLIIQGINQQTLFKGVAGNKEAAGLYRLLLKELLISLSPGIKKVFNASLTTDEIYKQVPLVTQLLSQLEYLISANHTIVDWNYELKNSLLIPDRLNDRWELGNLKTLFDWAIIIAIMKNKKKGDTAKAGKFLDWIKKKNEKREHFISIVSTNYDVALERELLEVDDAWNADRNIDFGVSWRDPVEEECFVYNRPPKPKYRILKLHGSTDWLKCKRCGFMYINPAVNIFKLPFDNKKSPKNSCHCGFWPLQPVLVTMSYIRKMEDPNLMEIWRNTFEELRTADEWIIVGYSLPPEDFDIRSLFLRALASNEKNLTVKVIQQSRKSQPQYDLFFGEGNYTFLEGGFAANIDHIISNRKQSPKPPFIKAKF